MRAEAQAHVDTIKDALALLRRFLDWDRALRRLDELNARVEDQALWSDPKAAVIWEAFKPESEPRRAPRHGDAVADKPRDAKPVERQEAPRDTDFLQREGGIY